MTLTAVNGTISAPNRSTEFPSKCSECRATIPDLTQSESELSAEAAADARWRKNHAEWMGFYSRMTEIC